jgi:hypothetical protein
MKKRLGAFILAIIMTLSVGVIAPASAASGDDEQQDNTETENTAAFGFAVSDAKIAKATATATLTVSTENTPADGISNMIFRVTSEKNSLTVTKVTPATGYTITSGSNSDGGTDYTWSSSTKVTTDTKLFTVTVKLADSSVINDDYKVTITPMTAWTKGTDGISTTQIDSSSTGFPATSSGTVTVTGGKNAIVIKTQPKAATTVVGKDATFKVVATSNTSDDLTYQWYRTTNEDVKSTLPDKDFTEATDPSTGWDSYSEEDGGKADTFTHLANFSMVGTWYIFCRITCGDYYKDTAIVKWTISPLTLSKTAIRFVLPEAESVPSAVDDDDDDDDDTSDTSSTTTVDRTNIVYTGSDITVELDKDYFKDQTGITPVVTGDDADITISSSELTGKDVGTYSVTVEGSGDLKGTVKSSWTIKPADITIPTGNDEITVKKGTILDTAKLLEDVAPELKGDNEATLSIVKVSNTKVLTLNKAKTTITAVGVDEAKATVTIKAANHNSKTVELTIKVVAKDPIDVTFASADTYTTTTGEGESAVTTIAVPYSSEGTGLNTIVQQATTTTPDGAASDWSENADGWTYTLTVGKKTTTYSSYGDLADVTIKNLGEYTIKAAYEDSEYMGDKTLTFKVVAKTGTAATDDAAKQGAIEVTGTANLNLYIDNLSETTYATTIAAMKTAITKAYPDAKAGLALAESGNIEAVLATGSDDAITYTTDTTYINAAFNAKKTAVVANLIEGKNSENKPSGYSAFTSNDLTSLTGTYYIIVYFTSTNYDSIGYKIPVKIQAKGNVTFTFADGTATYTGKEQTYEKATATDSNGKKLKATYMTYTYAPKAVAEGETNNASVGDNNKPLTAGTYTVTATYDDGVNKGTADATFTIEQKTLTITSATVKKTYDGYKTLSADDISKGKISGVVKGETLTEGTDYDIIAVDGSAAFSEADIGTKYKVDLTITFTPGDATTVTSKAANYKIADNYKKTVTGSIVAQEITVGIGTTNGTEGIDPQTFTGKAITPTVYVWGIAKDAKTGSSAIALLGEGDEVTGTDGQGTGETDKSNETSGTGTGSSDTIPLELNKDYVVKYSNNIKEGTNTAIVTVTTKKGSNYTFKATQAKFTITKNNLSNTSENEVNKFEYTINDNVSVVYGTTPKDSVLKGTVKLKSTGATIKGKWTWKAADTKAGTEAYAKQISELPVNEYPTNNSDATKIMYATFTPTNASYGSFDVPVKVTVTKATLTIAGITPVKQTYDPAVTKDTELKDKGVVTGVTFKVGKNEVTLASTTDYTFESVKYTKSANVGTQKLTVKIALTSSDTAKNYQLAKDTYTAGSVQIQAQTIAATISFTDAAMQSGGDGLTYTGKAQKPAIKVTYTPATTTVQGGEDGDNEDEGETPAAPSANDVTVDTKEYTVKYTNNIKAGTATVSITLNKSSNYKLSAACSTTFTIKKADPTLTVNDLTTTYNGKVPEASLIKGTAKFGKTALKGKWSFTSPVPDDCDTLAATAGTYSKVSVTFTPSDTTNFNTATGTMKVTINKATIKVTKASVATVDLSRYSGDTTTKSATMSTLTLSNTALKATTGYTVSATYAALTKGTQTVTYKVSLTDAAFVNYAFAGGAQTYTGTLKAKLTGELTPASSSTTTTTTPSSSDNSDQNNNNQDNDG